MLFVAATQFGAGFRRRSSNLSKRRLKPLFIVVTTEAARH
jgi:hypothetical protein